MIFSLRAEHQKIPLLFSGLVTSNLRIAPLSQNGISSCSAIFAGPTGVFNPHRQTDHTTSPVACDKISNI